MHEGTIMRRYYKSKEKARPKGRTGQKAELRKADHVCYIIDRNGPRSQKMRYQGKSSARKGLAFSQNKIAIRLVEGARSAYSLPQDRSDSSAQRCGLCRLRRGNVCSRFNKASRYGKRAAFELFVSSRFMIRTVLRADYFHRLPRFFHVAIITKMPDVRYT